MITSYGITDEEVKEIISIYNETNTFRRAAIKLNMSPMKIKKILISENIPIDDQTGTIASVSRLRNEGLSVGQIASILNISRNTVIACSPYQKGPYKKWTEKEKELILKDDSLINRSTIAKKVAKTRITNPQRPATSYMITSLKIKRMAAKLTQEELSRLSGISIHNIQSFEQGKRDIKKASIAVVTQLAKTLNCDYKEIVGSN